MTKLMKFTNIKIQKIVGDTIEPTFILYVQSVLTVNRLKSVFS